jgi:hypothetical protein
MRMVWLRQKCPDDGQLRLLIEPDEQPDQDVAAHVESCTRCQARLKDLRGAADETTRTIQALGETSHAIDAGMAYMTFRRAVRQGVENGSGGDDVGVLWNRRVTRLATTLVALVAVVALVAFSPMRTLADDFLAQFRVQKFHAITVPMGMIEPLQAALTTQMSDTDREQMKAELHALGTFETTFNMDVASLPSAMTVDEARAAYGPFAVPERMPAGFAGQPEVYVTEAGQAAYTLDVARARELVQRLGVPIYSLPDPSAYPTVTFSVDVPQAVVQKYTGEGGNTVVIGQMVSPSLNIPEGVDMDALREEILRFPGLPTDFVAELRAIDDWENTLVIPVPEGATSRDVTVNGRAGLLIEADEGAVVLWEKNGLLYAVGGDIGGRQVLDIANALD